MHVTVNWGGEIVGAEIVALSGKLSILNLLRFISLVIVRRISLTSKPFSLDTYIYTYPVLFFFQMKTLCCGRKISSIGRTETNYLFRGKKTRMPRTTETVCHKEKKLPSGR